MMLRIKQWLRRRWYRLTGRSLDAAKAMEFFENRKQPWNTERRRG